MSPPDVRQGNQRLAVGGKCQGLNGAGSRGASVNLEVELDSSLAMDATKLQERIRQLFALVRQSLAEELNGNRNGTTSPPRLAAKPPEASSESNGRQNNGTENGSTRLASPAQVKALYAITKQQGLDLYEVLRERFDIHHPKDLSLKQASTLIDALKSANA